MNTKLAYTLAICALLPLSGAFGQSPKLDSPSVENVQETAAAAPLYAVFPTDPSAADIPGGVPVEWIAGAPAGTAETVTVAGIGDGPPDDGTNDPVAPNEGDTYVDPPNNVAWVYNGTAWTIYPGSSGIIREEILADRVKVTFDGTSGDVTATYVQGTCTITVANGATLLSARVYGANADLSATQDFKVVIVDPSLGQDTDDFNVPLALVLVKNNQVNPTEAVYYELSVDPDPGIRMFDITAAGMTIQFTNLNSTVSHGLLLQF